MKEENANSNCPTEVGRVRISHLVVNFPAFKVVVDAVDMMDAAKLVMVTVMIVTEEDGALEQAATHAGLFLLVSSCHFS